MELRPLEFSSFRGTHTELVTIGALTDNIRTSLSDLHTAHRREQSYEGRLSFEHFGPVVKALHDLTQVEGMIDFVLPPSTSSRLGINTDAYWGNIHLYGSGGSIQGSPDVISIRTEFFPFDTSSLDTGALSHTSVGYKVYRIVGEDGEVADRAVVFGLSHHNEVDPEMTNEVRQPLLFDIQHEETDGTRLLKASAGLLIAGDNILSALINPYKIVGVDTSQDTALQPT